LALTGGLRLDHHEVYGNHWSPRLYAVWHGSEQLTIKGGVSRGFKAPDIRTIAPGYAYTTGGAGCTVGPTGTCGVIIGDPNLKPETSTSWELG
ncbi:TonB-dependent receptor, partial [Klebsiella pneumoniae]